MKKKLFDVICTLLFCILAVIDLLMIVGKYNNRVVFIGDKAAIWVMTDSMENTISARSYVLIEKVENAESEIKQNDIITFYSSDTLIKGKLNTHRVLRIDKDNSCFITKGDNNIVEDSFSVPYKDVVGRYVKSLPFFTVVGRFLFSSYGFAITMVALLALVCVVYLPEIIGAFKKTDGYAAEREAEINRRIAEEVMRLKAVDQNENK